MKYTITILFAAMLFVLVSCEKQEVVLLNENFIPVNECQSYAIDKQDLTVCLDSVTQDSRCPIDAVCIWQGIGITRFKFTTKNTDHLITLSTYKFHPYNKDTTLAGFKIELVNLAPQRELSKPFNYRDYVAEVNITKL